MCGPGWLWKCRSTCHRLQSPPLDWSRTFADFSSHADTDNFEEYRRNIEALDAQARQRVTAFQESVRRDENARLPAPSDETRRLLAEVNELREQFSAAVRELQDAAGIPEEVFDELERERLPALEDRYSLTDVLAVASTGDIDIHAAAAVEKLTALVDPAWLQSERDKAYRLPGSFLEAPLHVVGGGRIAATEVSSQRFARMLLVTADHLARRDDIDFFEAPMLVAEMAALGTRLDELRELGTEAEEKLRRLPFMTDDEVASTVYELLVGTACVREGLHTEMLPVDRSRKTPDLRIHNLSIPVSIECKRRLGLSKYETDEASHVRNLYAQIQPELRRYHTSVEALFDVEVSLVTTSTFADVVLPLIKSGIDRRDVATDWGHVVVHTLPYTMRLPVTRLYSPNYLQRVFGWNEAAPEWDGICCEVDPPDTVLVDRVKNPRSLKWVSRSAKANLKKSRDITSLWGRATQQIPAGDFGCIYIAYPEVNRREIADKRTTDIRQASKDWHHRWSVNIGVTYINRLYPRAVGSGLPDLIESTLPITADGEKHLLTVFPSSIFVPPPQR